MALLPFQAAADVQHGQRRCVPAAAVAAARSPNLASRSVPSGCSPAQSCGRPVAAAAGRSMPIRASSRWACADLLRCLPEQGHRRAPGNHPAQVGGEAAVEREAERAGHEAGGERDPVPQVNDPLAGLDPAPQLGRAARPRRGQVGPPGPAGWPGPCARSRRARRPARRAACPRTSARSAVSAGLNRFSRPIVDDRACAWVAAQKLPNPWVGKTSRASRAVRAASRCAEAYCARARVSGVLRRRAGRCGRSSRTAATRR